MKDSPVSNPSLSVARRKRLTVIFIASSLLLFVLIPFVLLKPSPENREQPTLVIRVDDIQDFAFREAQLFLLDESIANQIPISLAVIAGAFGEDSELVQAVKLAVSLGSEVTVHGWKHEDLAQRSLMEQVTLLAQSRSRIKEILGTNVSVLVPPMFSFNEDTLAAMHQTGYDIISTEADLLKPGVTSKVISLPATVSLSDFSNGTWSMKSFDSIKAELSGSVQKYGFAVMVTHPQEFLMDGKLDQGNQELYRYLLRNLTADYSFESLEQLGKPKAG